MKFLFIINPYSRGGKSKKLAEICISFLKNQNFEYDLKYVAEFEDAYRFSREGNLIGYDAVIAVGGDGTINKVLNGFYDRNGVRISKSKFGVIYTGTSPDFCKSYKVPLNIKRAVEVLSNYKSIKIPIGRIQYSTKLNLSYDTLGIESLKDTDVRYFACCANIGLGASLARKANSGIRKYIGDIPGTFISLLQILSKYKPSSYITLYDGARAEIVHVYNLSIGITKFIASGIKVNHNIKNNNNLLYSLQVSNVNVFNLPLMLYRIYSGKEIKNTNYLTLDYYSRIDVTGCSHNPEVEFDGDPAGFLPCSIEMAKDKLDLICS